MLAFSIKHKDMRGGSQLLVSAVNVYNVCYQNPGARCISYLSDILHRVLSVLSDAGIIWPVECIPYPLRYLSLALPQTYASESLRCIMYRGKLDTDTDTAAV